MNKRLILSIAVAVLGLSAVVLLVVNWTRSSRESDQKPGKDFTVERRTPSYQTWSLPPPRTVTKEAPSAPPVVDMKDDQGAVTGQGVRLRAGDILATVNRIPVTLADLVAVKGGQGEIVMDKAEFEARLKAAVEAELTLQEARNQGVALDVVQQDRIAKIAERHAATAANYREQGVNWSSVTPEQIALEQRQMAVSILQQNLVKKSAGLAPSEDPAEQAKYEAALRALLDKLASKGSVILNPSQRAQK
jgi:hypothetical protein